MGPSRGSPPGETTLVALEGRLADSAGAYLRREFQGAVIAPARATWDDMARQVRAEADSASARVAHAVRGSISEALEELLDRGFDVIEARADRLSRKVPEAASPAPRAQPRDLLPHRNGIRWRRRLGGASACAPLPAREQPCGPGSLARRSLSAAPTGERAARVPRGASGAGSGRRAPDRPLPRGLPRRPDPPGRRPRRVAGPSAETARAAAPRAGVRRA